MNKKYFLISLLIFILAFSIRVFYIFQKQSFHVDEILSRIVSVGRADMGVSYLIYDKKNYEGSVIKKFFFGEPDKPLLTDLKNLRAYNYNDDAHPSLYYSMLRIALNFSDYTPEGYIICGCFLNLLFFIFSFFILRKLLIRLFGDNKLVPVGLLIAFLNTGSISMTIFIRPYELQMLAIILISYVFVIIKDKLKNNENIFNLKDFLTVSLSVGFVFWTAYFLVFYVGLLGLILLWHARKNIKNLLSLIFYVLMAVGLTYMANTGYFQFLNGQRFTGLSDMDKTFSLTDYIYNFVSYFCNLSKFLFYNLLLIVLVVMLFFAKNKTDLKGISLVVCAFLWSLVVALIVPFPVVRYIAPAFAILSVSVLYLLRKLNNKEQIIFACLISVIYIACAFFPQKMESSDTAIYYKKDYFSIPLGGVIENLYTFDMPDMDNNVPVLVKNYKWYCFMFILSKLNDNQIYYNDFDTNNFLNLNNYPAKHYYLFLDTWYKGFIVPNADIKSLGNFSKFTCYEIFVKD